MKKTYVLDTNVLLSDPDCLTVFEDNNVCLPITVLEELDKFKTNQGELGRNARKVSRQIDALRLAGSLSDGVSLGEGMGCLRVESENVAFGFKHLANSNDNYILGTTRRLAEKIEAMGGKVILVTKDINLRIKADVLGVEAQDYLNEKVSDSPVGSITNINLDPGDVHCFYADFNFGIPVSMPENACVVASSYDGSTSALLRVKGGQLRLVKARKDVNGISPRNAEQRFLADMLMDPTLDLVIVNGVAGSGKTLLSLACGLEWMHHAKRERRIMITKAIEAVGQDIGFLPGTKEEKMAEWVKPFMDNLELMMDGDYIRMCMEKGLIELEAMTYLRGRSLMSRFIIIDEVQNIAPKHLKTIVSRVADSSKLVLLGDSQQIDNAYLDATNNGLVYAMSRMEDVPNVGLLSMAKSERGRLAKAAIERL